MAKVEHQYSFGCECCLLIHCIFWKETSFFLPDAPFGGGWNVTPSSLVGLSLYFHSDSGEWSAGLFYIQSHSPTVNFMTVIVLKPESHFRNEVLASELRKLRRRLFLQPPSNVRPTYDFRHVGISSLGPFCGGDLRSQTPFGTGCWSKVDQNGQWVPGATKQGILTIGLHSHNIYPFPCYFFLFIGLWLFLLLFSSCFFLLFLNLSSFTLNPTDVIRIERLWIPNLKQSLNCGLLFYILPMLVITGDKRILQWFHYLTNGIDGNISCKQSCKSYYQDHFPLE